MTESIPKTVRLIAARSQSYCGRALRVGDAFEANEDDAADLVAIRYARRDDGGATTARRYRRRDLQAEK